MKILIKENELRSLVAESVSECLDENARKSRKEAFRRLHKQARTINEDVMSRFYGIDTNRSRPVRIDEVTLDRVLKKHGDNGMINIRANNSKKSQEYNDEQTKNLIRDLKQSGYSYLPTYGSYRSPDTGVEDDYEPSFVVFNYDTKGNPLDFEKLRQFGIYLCGKYDQDSVLIKAPGENPIYVDRNGNKYNSTESNKVWKNDPTQEYFTSFKSKDDVADEENAKLMHQYKIYCNRNGLPKTKKGFEEYCAAHRKDINSIGKRYTYDIGFGECYVNPMPCHLTERMKRKGEVMIWE